MTRFNWYAREISTQILRIQVPEGTSFSSLFDRVFVKFTRASELISVDSIHSGTMIELTYSIGMKKSDQIPEFMDELKELNGGNKVTLVAGYNSNDL